MHCKQAYDNLDNYSDGVLGYAEAHAIAAHIEHCQHCAEELASRRSVRELLEALPVDGPDRGFLERAVAQAAAASQADSAHNRRADDRAGPAAGRRIRNALAAVFALVFVSTVTFTALEDGANPTPTSGYPEVSMTTNTVTPVKLMFASEDSLEDARLSIQLPVGIELVGYNGRSNLSWTTDLEPGKNVLQLPLVGRVAGSEQLVAKLEHPKGSKTFRLQLTVK